MLEFAFDPLFVRSTESEEKYRRTLRKAAAEMNGAAGNMVKAVDSLVDAVRILDGLPEYDRVVSLMNQLDDLACEVRITANKFKMGVIE